MPALELFEKLTVTEVARWLDLHPFEVVRFLGSEGPLPANLRFDQAILGHIRELGGVETWWEDDIVLVADTVRGRALLRTSLQLLLDHGVTGGATTRADNLFRGLEPADQWLVRRAVNLLLRDGILVGIPTSVGLRIQIPDAKLSVVKGIVSGTSVPAELETLWS